MVTINIGRETVLPWLVSFSVGFSMLFLLFAWAEVYSGFYVPCDEPCSTTDFNVREAHLKIRATGNALLAATVLNWLTVALLAWYVIPGKKIRWRAPPAPRGPKEE